MLVVCVTADVGAELEETIQKSWPDNIVKFVRSTERLGLIRARLTGADAASGDVLVFLDAHCEANVVWYYFSVGMSKKSLFSANHYHMVISDNNGSLSVGCHACDNIRHALSPHSYGRCHKS